MKNICLYCDTDFIGEDIFCSPECKQLFLEEAKVFTEIEYGDDKHIVYVLFEEKIATHNCTLKEYAVIPFSAQSIISRLCDVNNAFKKQCGTGFNCSKSIRINKPRTSSRYVS